MNIFWFRQDLRLRDNPALIKAFKSGNVLPIYILEEVDDSALGSASKVWLHHSLYELNQSLDDHLQFFKGDPEKIFSQLMKQFAIEGVYWNRCYEPWRIKRDTSLKQWLKQQGITVHSENGSLLWEPWEVLKSDGTPYKVFTPYYRKGCLSKLLPRKVLQAPRQKSFVSCKRQCTLKELRLLPDLKWGEEVMSSWTAGELAAHKTLKYFLKNKATQYKKGRDFPALEATSKLSPYLHFGELSPNQVWYAASEEMSGINLDCFQSEIAWREFSYYLLYHFPGLPRKNFQSKFDKFPWKRSKKMLLAWQQGQTGYPIIDAGMRELWQTGYMHNRVRMIVASFLVKNLLIHWHEGASWFWDCLLDADLANNSASWQWVAGSGADAAPYFRIFNPVTQSQKFDPEATYIKQYVPEISKLPIKYIFDPSSAPEKVLSDAGIVLGDDYPKAIVDLKASRQQALDAFKGI